MWDVLLMPLLFTFFGVAVRGAAAAYRNNTGLRPKRLGVLLGTYLPLAIAMYFGLTFLFHMYNPNSLERYVYLNTLLTKKIKIAHYLAFLLPLLATVGVVLYDRRDAAIDRRVRVGRA